MPRSAWPLSDVVVEFARQVARSSDFALAAAGRRAQERLEQPLCVAVVGRMKAGKSTLLNALLETAISPTAGGECTEVVYVFQHRMHTTAVAHYRDDRDPVPVVLDGTTLPRELPIPPGELRDIEVTLPVDWLARASLHGEHDRVHPAGGPRYPRQPGTGPMQQVPMQPGPMRPGGHVGPQPQFPLPAARRPRSRMAPLVVLLVLLVGGGIFTVVQITDSSSSGGPIERTTGPNATSTGTALEAVWVYESPYLSAPTVYALTAGETVEILCTTYGETVINGVTGLSSDLWDGVEGGGFVPDVMLDTGTTAPTMPSC